MTLLTISDFACIKSGTVKASQFTILVGPQASGKSVVAKLLHFFNEVVSRPPGLNLRDESYADFIARQESSFSTQFPDSAWGPNKFRIEYEAGPITASVTRDGRQRHGLRLEFSDVFRALYERLLSDYRQVREKAHLDGPRAIDFELYWPIQQQHEERVQELLGPDYVWHQIFVPAGRSFYTTLGKTAVALGSSVVIDGFTQRFGRLITSLRDETFDSARVMNDSARDILGGQVVRDGDTETLVSPDGRRIPLSLMSSGQQEFYPLALSLSYARQLANAGLWVFIEEPEAHLFPKAQSDLIDLLVDTARVGDGGTRMFVTSHSPYSLSKFNNLLKAGHLAAARPELASSIDKVIPSSRWLTEQNLSAYALIDGVISPLIDEDGLIDAGYLDSVSSSLADEFGGLLELEFNA